MLSDDNEIDYDETAEDGTCLNKLFLSGAGAGEISSSLGLRHYSYKFVEKHFFSALQNSRFPVIRLALPEYYFSAKSFRSIGIAEGEKYIHLTFRSPEDLRILKGAYNISCFYWEFEHLKDFILPGENPFESQVRMLSLVDEVWVGCEFTRSILLKYSIDNVYVIPAPVILSTSSDLDQSEVYSRISYFVCQPLSFNFLLDPFQNSANAKNKEKALGDVLADVKSSFHRKVYLSIFNPEDFRKNADVMIRAFDHFSKQGNDAILLIKLVSAKSRFSLEDAIALGLGPKLDCGSVFENDQVLFINEYLDDAEMDMLYRLSDFYFCTSIAEGQNLPMLEAMARGVIPVSPRHTAMTDYLTEENSFIIPSTSHTNQCKHLAGSIAGKPFSTNVVEVKNVCDALKRSFDACGEEIIEMKEACREAIRHSYSSVHIQKLISRRLNAINVKQKP